jgi:cellulose synthase/poly-beta-1,6-N-acetylglucosamine synthase-like glycosyltransferase
LIYLFIAVIVIILYTYLGYPVLLFCKKPFRLKKNESYYPPVTLLITAYNEQDFIVDKLRNSLALDYLKGELQILLIDDGSDDETVARSKQVPGVDIISISHSGKTVAQNEGVKYAKGEIIVFSDANSMYNKDALKQLVSNFSDRRVGCVCGELRYFEERSDESLYWKYEVLLKRLEGRLGRLLGANGSIYAVRKDLYVPLADEAISDFIEPILIYGKGYKVIYEPGAVAVEKTPIETFNRKRRIILRSLTSLKYITKFLNPLKRNNVLLTLLSHKLLRWFTPILFMGLFILTIFLLGKGWVYQIMLGLQLLFLMSALVSRKVRYFINVNLAACLAIWDWIRGKKVITWEVIR